METIQKQEKLYSKIIKVGLFTLFSSYLGILLAVLSHEIIGHGAVSLLLGGYFNGFAIYPDAMGWAAIDIAHLSALRQALVYAGGFIITTLLSIVFFLCALRQMRRERPLLTLFFSAFSITFLLDSIPYFLLDAVFIGGIGDVSRIFYLYPDNGLRVVVAIISAVLYLAGLIAFNMLLMQSAIHIFGIGQNIKVRIALYSAVAFVFQLLSGMAFDWTNLVPVQNINTWARISYALFVIMGLGVAIAVVYLRDPSKRKANTQAAFIRKWPVILTGLICFAVVLLTVIFFQDGVFWS